MMMVMKYYACELGHLLVSVLLFNLASYMVLPAITDVTMEAVCPGKDECSPAIFLTGFSQAITGLGALVATPVIGNFSDLYGRKVFLLLPPTVAVLPLLILACSRKKEYVYAYYAVKVFAGMVADGCMQCLALAYVADKVCERRRGSAFGVLSGVSAAGFVGGTLAARFLSTSSTFQVATAVAALAVVYMKAFLKEPGTGLEDSSAVAPLLCHSVSDEEQDSPKLPPRRKIPSLSQMVDLISSSLTLSRAAFVTFFYGLGETGLHSALLYYLKAEFGFTKNQFADLLLIFGIAGTFSQLTLLPFLAPRIGEERLLSVGLLASLTYVILFSIAWSSWVPYFAAGFTILSAFVTPCIRSTVSKKVGSSEQGMAQGCITGISSFASIISPLLFTPLAAMFLSEDAPFNFKGFSIMCAGFAMMTALVLSVFLRTATSDAECQKTFSIATSDAECHKNVSIATSDAECQKTVSIATSGAECQKTISIATSDAECQKTVSIVR